ncbi:MAG: triose-phosphate isomerase, partial [Candidatus Latescibacterota bacterium]
FTVVQIHQAITPTITQGSTGLTASPDQADAVHGMIRQVLADLYNEAVAQSVRIQYGGSVKPDNAVDLFGQPNIDGGLIGGAALVADSFAAIVKAAV